MLLHCTAAFCGLPATRIKKTFLAWNIDFFKGADFIGKLFHFYINTPFQGYRYLSFGIPGVINAGLMNEHGLSVVMAAVGMKDGGGQGLMDMDIIPYCLQHCRTVDEVIEVYQTSNLFSFPGIRAGSLMNLNCLWADAQGQGVAIEHSSHFLYIARAEQGIMAIANHHQFIADKTGSPTPQELPLIKGSYCRLNRMWQLLKRHYGQLDLETIKHIMADHHVSPGCFNDDTKRPVDDSTICVHYWNLRKYLKEGKWQKAFEVFLAGKTLASVIIEPLKREIHICRGNPCQGHYRTIQPFKEGLPFYSGSKNISKKWLLGLAKILEKTLPIGP